MAKKRELGARRLTDEEVTYAKRMEAFGLADHIIASVLGMSHGHYLRILRKFPDQRAVIKNTFFVAYMNNMARMQEISRWNHEDGEPGKQAMSACAFLLNTQMKIMAGNDTREGMSNISKVITRHFRKMLPKQVLQEIVEEENAEDEEEIKVENSAIKDLKEAIEVVETASKTHARKRK